MEILALGAPFLLLTAVVAAQLYAVFEPYFAQKTQEGRELMDYFAEDVKLDLIAEWWTAQLLNQRGGYFDNTSNSAVMLRDEIHRGLIRNRFLTNDDPSVMRWDAKGMHKILAQALEKTEFEPAERSGEPNFELQISAKLVKPTNGHWVWRGAPQAYRSRFKDMYYEDEYAG